MISNHFPAATFGRDYSWHTRRRWCCSVGAAKLIRDYL